MMEYLQLLIADIAEWSPICKGLITVLATLAVGIPIGARLGTKED